MNKIAKKVFKITATLFLLLIVLKVSFHEWRIFFGKDDPNVKYDIYGQDKYTYFGDGRFQIMNWPTDVDKLQLNDYKYYQGGPSTTTFEIQKYLYVDGVLYVEGDFYAGGWGEDQLGNRTLLGSTNVNNGDVFGYKSEDEIPSYLILNVETGDGRYLLNKDEMSEEERTIFNSDLSGKSCLKERTCYEQGVNPPWWEFFTFWR